jgi:hypothetical protein
MMMTKKDYERIAASMRLCLQHEGDRDTLARLCGMMQVSFKNDNPRFDRDTFFNAIFNDGKENKV